MGKKRQRGREVSPSPSPSPEPSSDHDDNDDDEDPRQTLIVDKAIERGKRKRLKKRKKGGDVVVGGAEASAGDGHGDEKATAGAAGGGGAEAAAPDGAAAAAAAAGGDAEKTTHEDDVRAPSTVVVKSKAAAQREGTPERVRSSLSLKSFTKCWHPNPKKIKIKHLHLPPTKQTHHTTHERRLRMPRTRGKTTRCEDCCACPVTSTTTSSWRRCGVSGAAEGATASSSARNPPRLSRATCAGTRTTWRGRRETREDRTHVSRD